MNLHHIINMNDSLQKKILSAGSSMVESAIVKILLEVQPQSMGVADLGCSSGPNSLTVISKIIHLVDTVSRQMGRPVPELRVSLNDLPGNDFNDVFESLPGLYKKVKNDYGIESCYVSGVPGSFYGRLFPAKSLHFVHSSSSLHWLSQVSNLDTMLTFFFRKTNTHINSIIVYALQVFHKLIVPVGT